jgi:hypothetical protein
MTSVYGTPIPDDIIAINMAIVNDPQRLAQWRKDIVQGTQVEQQHQYVPGWRKSRAPVVCDAPHMSMSGIWNPTVIDYILSLLISLCM